MHTIGVLTDPSSIITDGESIIFSWWTVNQSVKLEIESAPFVCLHTVQCTDSLTVCFTGLRIDRKSVLPNPIPSNTCAVSGSLMTIYSNNCVLCTLLAPSGALVVIMVY